MSDAAFSGSSIPPIGVTYFQIGRVVAGLHAQGLSLPAEDLLASSSYGTDESGSLKVATLAVMEKLRPLPDAIPGSSENPTLKILLSAALTVSPEIWNYFGAGYLQELETREQGNVVRELFDELMPKVKRSWEAKALHAQSLEKHFQGNYLESIELLEQEIAIYRQIGCESVAGRIYNNLGTSYSQAGREAEAMKCYQTAYDTARDLNDPYGIVIACLSLASVLEGWEEKESAAAYAQEGLQALEIAGMSSVDREQVRSKLLEFL
jgi:tetratricopeptide (TPR) repeat protein